MESVMPRTAVVALQEVCACRGETQVLHDLSCHVAEGETVAIVGRSGAGKSTLLKLINSMVLPVRGRVLVHGCDTREWNPTELRRRSGYVLQDVGLFPHLDVARNVGMVPELSGWPPARVAARVEAVLNLVGLSPTIFARRWPDELSGGERQRVGVARALAIDPPLLLMDEPFGALDPITRSDLHREFGELRKRLRKTIVLVTHDIREAFRLADRVGVLEDGRLIAFDAPSVLRASAHPGVSRLLAAADV